MPSSPTPNSHLVITSPEPSNNCDIISMGIDTDDSDDNTSVTGSESVVTSSFAIATQPEMCDCANQLGHWDWNGVPHKDLPKLCKRSMGINIDNAPTPQRKDESDDESDDDTSVTESLAESIESCPDHEYSNFIRQAVLKDSISNASGDPKDMTNTFEQAGLKDSIRNASGNPRDTTNTLENANFNKESIAVDKVDAANPTCTKGHKRRLSEDENLDTSTCKKSKKKTDIRIKFCDMKKRSAVKISVKISL